LREVLEANQMTQYVIKPNDIPDLMDCMTECFAVTEKVNARMLAEKMIQKTGRHFTYQNIGYLYTLLGFIASPVENTAERYLVRDDKKIAELKANAEHFREVSKVGREINMSASPYSRRNYELIY
jgi:proline dehydrogenase